LHDSAIYTNNHSQQCFLGM